MTRSSLSDTRVRLAVKVYSVLLLAYPAACRREYGASMLQLFRDWCRDIYRQRGMAGLVRLGGPILIDTAVNVVVEHVDVFRERNESMTSEQHTRVIASSTLPLVVGVVLFVTNRDYMSHLLAPGPSQPAGWLMTVVALILMGAAYVVQRKIVTGATQPTSEPAVQGGASNGEWILKREFGLALSALFLVLPAVLLVVLGPSLTMVLDFLQK